MKGRSRKDEVRDLDGTTFFLRILPYRAAAREESEPIGTVRSPSYRRRRCFIDRYLGPGTRPLETSPNVGNRRIVGPCNHRRHSGWDDHILNRGAERIYGYNSEDTIGRHIKILTPLGSEDQRPASSKGCAAVKPSSTWKYSVFTATVYYAPCRARSRRFTNADRCVIGASAIGRDVTQLRRFQNDVKEREARIRLLLDSTAEGIMGFGPDGTCTLVNPACIRMLGYSSADELIGRTDRSSFSRPDGTDHFSEQSAIFSPLRTGKGTHSDQETMTRPTAAHRVRVLELSGPPWEPGGRFGVTFLDITDRKIAEDEIRLAARRREEFLADAFARTAKSSIGCRQRRRSDALFYRQGRKPWTWLVKLSRGNRVTCAAAHYLLDVSRITRGGIELRKEDLDLREIVRTAIESSIPVCRTLIRVAYRLARRHLLPIRGDSARSSRWS